MIKKKKKPAAIDEKYIKLVEKGVFDELEDF